MSQDDISQCEVVFQGKCGRCGTLLTITHPRHRHCCSWGVCNGDIPRFEYRQGSKIRPSQMKRAVLEDVNLAQDFYRRIFIAGFTDALGVARVDSIDYATFGNYDDYVVSSTTAQKFFELARNPDLHLLEMCSTCSDNNKPQRFFVVSKFSTHDLFWENACNVFNENADFRAHVLSILNAPVLHRWA